MTDRKHKYRCKFCKEKFYTKQPLKIHIINNHEEHIIEVIDDTLVIKDPRINSRTQNNQRNSRKKEYHKTTTFK